MINHQTAIQAASDLRILVSDVAVAAYQNNHPEMQQMLYKIEDDVTNIIEKLCTCETVQNKTRTACDWDKIWHELEQS